MFDSELAAPGKTTCCM